MRHQRNLLVNFSMVTIDSNLDLNNSEIPQDIQLAEFGFLCLVVVETTLKPGILLISVDHVSVRIWRLFMCRVDDVFDADWLVGERGVIGGNDG